MTSRKRLLFAFLAVSVLASCGDLQDRDGSDAGRNRDATDAGDTGLKEDGSPPIYSGMVLATKNTSGTTTTYAASADFGTLGAFGIGGCFPSGTTVGSCCCESGSALPGGPFPDAADVTLESAGGTSTLATIARSVATLYRVSDLGGATPATFYSPTASKAWKPGDALLVSAKGDQVHSFSGTLQTGALLSGITPSIGPEPVVIDRTRDFDITWTADGGSNETVLLELGQVTTRCYCAVPDSAAKLTLSSTLLGQFEAGPVSGQIRLERLVISTASCDNATIDLIGAVAETADVTFQ